jgi:integrase
MASTTSVNQSVRITKLVVDRVTPPASGQIFIRDAELHGFALRVTAGGAKSFVLEKRVKGRLKRITIARYPALTAEQARKQAQKLIGRIVTGDDPLAEREQARLQGMTLHQVFTDYLADRRTLKDSTVYNYRRFMKVAFPDWQAKPLSTITKDMVARRHRELGETRGEAYANHALRLLRALFNFAIVRYEDPAGERIVRDNPVARLSHTRSWYRINRRQTVIPRSQLPAWFAAVRALKEDCLKALESTDPNADPLRNGRTPANGHAAGNLSPRNGSDSVNGISPVNGNGARNEAAPLPSSVNGTGAHNVGETRARARNGATGRNMGPPTPEATIRARSGETVADYLLLLLFTGLRRGEAAALTWANVDLAERILKIPDPKNRKPFALPLSDFVHDLLAASAKHKVNDYVFPGTGAKGYLVEPRNHMDQVIKASGVSFTLHDLRRTFITVADRLDMSAFAIKRLVNHKTSSDVTDGYIVIDAERLRGPMQRVTDYLLRTAGVRDSAEIIPITREAPGGAQQEGTEPDTSQKGEGKSVELTTGSQTTT